MKAVGNLLTETQDNNEKHSGCNTRNICVGLVILTHPQKTGNARGEHINYETHSLADDSKNENRILIYY